MSLRHIRIRPSGISSKITPRPDRRCRAPAGRCQLRCGGDGSKESSVGSSSTCSWRSRTRTAASGDGSGLTADPSAIRLPVRLFAGRVRRCCRRSHRCFRERHVESAAPDDLPSAGTPSFVDSGTLTAGAVFGYHQQLRPSFDFNGTSVRSADDLRGPHGGAHARMLAEARARGTLLG